ncbi:MAG: glycosyltransferase [Chitinophagaceae bacterium]|nr:MAG: glycosyltransferase [Chitinophagaceae bacterium]
MAKVCMLTLEHSPKDDRIFYKEACSLKEAGFDVYILCRAEPDGGMWDMGKKQLLNPGGEEMIEIQGVKIIGVPFVESKLDLFLFKGFRDSFSSKFIEKALELNADVYHAHEPSSAFLGQKVVSRLQNAKLVFDMHESWLGTKRKESLIKLLLLPKLQYMITANPMTRGHLMKQNPDMKVKVIYNYPQKKYFNFPPEKKNFEKTVLAHEGLIPFNRGLKEMLAAFIEVLNKGNEVELIIIGETSGEEKEYLNEYIEKYKLEKNITETGWLNYEKVPQALSEANVGLIFKTPDLNNVLGGPSIKLFNYFASSMAVFDVGLPESERFMDLSENGISVLKRDVSTISEALSELTSSPELRLRYAQNGYKKFMEEMNWEEESKQLVNFYHWYLLNKKPYIKR